MSHRACPPSRFFAMCALLLVIGPAHQPELLAGDVPGFWSEFLHGFLVLFSFIASLFAHVRICAFPYSGGWYDFGYLLGAASFLGGGGASASNFD